MNYSKLRDTIYTRRSHRSYENAPLTDGVRAEIESAFAEAKSLYPEIKTELRILCRDEIRSLMPWMPKESVAIYSECREGYLENAGFILGQMDLFVQSIGLGACWVGLAGPKSKQPTAEGLEFVILLAIGKSRESMRSSAADFKRKPMGEICADPSCSILEPCRLAASSVNSQPWYFVPHGDRFDVYMRNLVRTKGLARMNRIDVGIALSQLFVENCDSFSAERIIPAPARRDMEYITSVRI